MKPPTPNGTTGLRALQAIIKHRSMLSAMSVFHHELGDVFQPQLPGFSPIVLVGPEANRFILVDQRDHLPWRMEKDPITRLLRQGLLVTDGDIHDVMRRHMTPAFHKRMLADYVDAMWQYTDQIGAAWSSGDAVDMLDQIRRIALLILVKTMFRVDFTPEMQRLWPAVLKSLSYVGPGLWLLWADMPRPGFARPLQKLNDYLHRLIAERRAVSEPGDDLLSILVNTPEVSDAMIRDQMFTMLVAGHDTTTAMLAWAMYLLGQHQDITMKARAEVDAVLGDEPPTFEHLTHLKYLDQIINETMRLYPPLHLGNRLATTDLEFQGYTIPAGSRVLYSPYLTHRHPDHWPHPTTFNPDHFAPGQARPPYAFVPFGGGPRICLGAAFAQVEARAILARILQKFYFRLLRDSVHMHMGVTLEPRPGVIMQLEARHSQ